MEAIEREGREERDASLGIKDDLYKCIGCSSIRSSAVVLKFRSNIQQDTRCDGKILLGNLFINYHDFVAQSFCNTHCLILVECKIVI